MEIIDILDSANFIFDKASNLKEDEHEKAFLVAFEKIFMFLRDVKVDWFVIEPALNLGEKVTVLDGKIHMQAPDFYQELVIIARNIYMSDIYEVKIDTDKYCVVLNSDPIYFFINSKINVGRD